MNERLKKISIFSCALATLAALIYYGLQKTEANETTPSAINPETLEHTSTKIVAAEYWNANAQRLVDQRRIVPGSYKALGPKAHEIIRSGDFRPPGDALVHVKQLMRRSENGDANAAYEIYLTVNECETFTSERADLHLDSATKIGAEGAFLGKSERILNECSALVLDGTVQGADWLSKAASMGSSEAQRDYAASPEKVIGPFDESIDTQKLAEWKENAQKYLFGLAGQGNISVLADLEFAYAHGRFGPPDTTMALAYATAASRANPGSVTEEELEFYRSNLSHGELIKAQSLSASIFDNCCNATNQD